MQSESRRNRRWLSKHSATYVGSYSDSRGYEYDFKWVAAFFSLVHFIGACFKNGFPVVVPRLWYTAWAFYPFVLVDRRVDPEKAVEVLNHERIHIRQQRDIHLWITLPILLCLFVTETTLGISLWPWLPLLLFIPTAVYALTAAYAYFVNVCFYDRNISPTEARRLTPFEREANGNQADLSYLLKREKWAVMKYWRIWPKKHTL